MPYRSRRTLHGAQSAHLPHDPIHLLNVLGRAGRVAEFAFRVVLLRQVEQDGATLENTLRAVGHGRDATIGVDLQEPAAMPLSVHRIGSLQGDQLL